MRVLSPNETNSLVTSLYLQYLESQWHQWRGDPISMLFAGDNKPAFVYTLWIVAYFTFCSSPWEMWHRLIPGTWTTSSFQIPRSCQRAQHSGGVRWRGFMTGFYPALCILQQCACSFCTWSTKLNTPFSVSRRWFTWSLLYHLRKVSSLFPQAFSSKSRQETTASVPTMLWAAAQSIVNYTTSLGSPDRFDNYLSVFWFGVVSNLSNNSRERPPNVRLQEKNLWWFLSFRPFCRWISRKLIYDSRNLIYT